MLWFTSERPKIALDNRKVLTILICWDAYCLELFLSQNIRNCIFSRQFFCNIVHLVPLTHILICFFCLFVTGSCCFFFYKCKMIVSEVIAARDIMDKYTSQRLTRRKGSDIARSTVEDMLKICLDPLISLPDFCARILPGFPLSMPLTVMF